MAAQIKKYDPNQYNFGDFAKTMNQNFAIERAQNGQGGAFSVNGGVNAANPVNLGGTTNSQTLGNLGTFGTRDRYNNITGNFTGLLKRFNTGEQVIFGEPSSSPQQEPKQEIITEQEPKQEIITDEGSSVGTEGTGNETGGTGTVTDPKADALKYINGTPGLLERLTSLAGNQVNAGEGAMDFETWQSAYSVDPVVEYQNAQAQLDYEFKTWMSDYGARAEQLYQMGLSNSGVSDIYGANAYTAYVQASMDLKRAQIQQQKENRQMYQKYVDQYEADKAAKTEAANIKMSSAFNTYSAEYHPGLEGSVRASLAANGMSESEINTVIGNLNAYYYALPEDQRPDVVLGNATVDAAVSWLNTNYTSGMTDEELSAMLGATYGADVVQKALEKFAPFKAVIDRLAGDEAARNAFSAMLEMISAGDTDIESLKAKAKGLGYSEDAIATAAENILPFLTEAQNAALDDTTINALAGDIAGKFENGYTGSAEDKVIAMQFIERTESAQYADQIIAKMDANIADVKEAAATDMLESIENIDIDDLTVSDVEAYIDTIAKTYGEGSQTYEKLRGSIATKLISGYKQALASPDESASFLGVNDDTVIADVNGKEITWAKADSEARAFYVISSLTDQYKAGVISELGYVETMSDYIKEDTRTQSEGLGNYIDTYYFIKDLGVSSSVQESLTKALVESVTLKSTYVYTHDDATGKYKTVNISNKNKQGGVQYPLVVSDVSDNENAALNKAFNQGQDIYELGGEIYVCVHAANNAKTFYKVDQYASEDYVSGKYGPKRTEEIKAEQKAFFDIVKQYAHLYRSDEYGIEDVLYGDRQSTGAEGMEEYMKDRLGIGK